MKKGFTLAELILTMGIIGIIAAIITPSLGDIMPDQSKAKVLKAYNTLTNMTKEIIDNPSMYTEDYDSQSNIMYEGLASYRSVPDQTNYPDNVYAGTAKYARLLSTVMSLDGDVTSISNGCSFTTTDGIFWKITANTPTSELLGTTRYMRITYDVVIDTNGENVGKDCYYGQSGCIKPDLYKFTVDTFGHVNPNDSLTKAYLLNPNKMNDRKNDYAEAAKLE